MVTEDKRYGEKIIQEAVFWGRFEEEANQYGIPWWCDLRRATKISQVICGWMHDPKIEEILRGYYKKRIIEIASEKKGIALDLGCGAGWLSLELAREGMNVDGYDISQERIRIAKYYLKNNPFKQEFGSINYQVKDINNLRLEENKYNSVVVWDTLHHIVEIDRLIKEIHKSLKANGTLTVYDHIGLERKNYIIIKLLQIPIRVWQRLKRLFMKEGLKNSSKVVPKTVEEMFESPFEDITGIEMVDAVKRYFLITTFRTQLCFLGACANYLVGLPDTPKYRLLHVLKLVDGLLIKMCIFKGEYVFIIAKKREVE